jgi:LPXTG-site transpeptidase (sortase) family protein
MGEKRDIRNGKPRPWKFIGVFFLVFFLIAVFLYAIDFVPEAPGSEAPDTVAQTAVTPVATRQETLSQTYPSELPVRITAPSVGIDAPVGNPSSLNTEVLDGALARGAVRYPESGLLGENARMYIFGHQSGLPIVHNQAYKTFNNLQDLKVGDEIMVYSATAIYRYRVASVTQTTAAAGVVALGSGARTLTLSTCDSFGTKSDRFVVTAEFLSRQALTTAS